MLVSLNRAAKATLKEINYTKSLFAPITSEQRNIVEMWSIDAPSAF